MDTRKTLQSLHILLLFIHHPNWKGGFLDLAADRALKLCGFLLLIRKGRQFAAFYAALLSFAIVHRNECIPSGYSYLSMHCGRHHIHLGRTEELKRSLEKIRHRQLYLVTKDSRLTSSRRKFPGGSYWLQTGWKELCRCLFTCGWRKTSGEICPQQKAQLCVPVVKASWEHTLGASCTSWDWQGDFCDLQVCPWYLQHSGFWMLKSPRTVWSHIPMKDTETIITF